MSQEASSSPPPMQRGWMRKQARSGFIKNWQTRYFVLHNGKIAYYQEQMDRFPYGDVLKGEMSLHDATVVNDPKRFTDKQIFISAARGEKDMLVETESAAEANEWLRAIAQHIAFATANFAGMENKATLERYNSQTSFSDSFSRKDTVTFEDPDSPAPTPPSSSPVSPHTQQPLTHTQTQAITAHPVLVIKALRVNGEKVFVNLTEHTHIPFVPSTLNVSFSKWPVMIISPARSLFVEEKDKDKERGNGGGENTVRESLSGNEVTLYDAIVNPQVSQIIAKDPAAKDATCQRVLRLLRKMFGEDLTPEYKLPRINKKYKGELQAILVPCDLSALAKTKSPLHVSFVTSDNTHALTSSVSLPQTPTPTHNTTLASPTLTQNRRGSLVHANTLTVLSDRSLPNTPQSISSQSDVNSPLTRRLSATSPNPTDSGNSRRASGAALFKNSVEKVKLANSNAKIHTQKLPRSLTAPVQPTTPPPPPPKESRGVKKVIPYMVHKPSGLIAKVRPDKNSSNSKVLLGQSRVFVVARRIAADAQPWLKTTEGWVMETAAVGSTQRLLTPSLNGQPLSVRVVRTRFEDADDNGSLRTSYAGRQTFRASQSGWMGFRASALKEDFVTVFLLEITFNENAFVLVSRSLGEILTLGENLRQSRDKVARDRITRGPQLSFTQDGDLSLLQDVHLLVALVEEVEEFLSFLINSVPLERLKDRFFEEFLTPKEDDAVAMNVELSTKRGAGGGWDVEEPLPIEY